MGVRPMADADGVKEAFRRMDALAATGEDTPEYRAAWAEWEKLAVVPVPKEES